MSGQSSNQLCFWQTHRSMACRHFPGTGATHKIDNVTSSLSSGSSTLASCEVVQTRGDPRGKPNREMKLAACKAWEACESTEQRES